MPDSQPETQVDVPTVSMIHWGKFVLIQLAIVVLAGVLFMLAGLLHVWETIFPTSESLRVVFGPIISWVVLQLLLGAYVNIMSRVLIKPYFEGFKHLRAGQFEQALAAFEQQYTLFDERPSLGKLYSFILLDSSKYSHRELALLNQAYAYTQLGKSEEAIRCYEQCVALNPKNGMAVFNLNTVGALTGGEIRPMPEHLPVNRHIDRRLVRRVRAVRLIAAAVVFVLCGICSLVIFIPGMGLTAGVLVSCVGSLLIGVVLASLYRLSSLSLILMDFNRGERFLKRHRYREAINAFRKQYAFFDEYPWLDEWRWLILLSPTTYSYREWVLLRMAYAHLQLGEGDAMVKRYEECLALNPDNRSAASSLNFINAVLSSQSPDQQETGSSGG